jgi:D-3-phosphoglycerate dehydrogenase
MPRVLVTPPMFEGDWPYRENLEDNGFEVVFPTDFSLVPNDEKYLLSQLEGIEAVMASGESYHKGIFTQANLRIVSRTGVGYDSVNVPDATESNVAVAITPGTNEHSVAEQAISMITGVYRGFPFRDATTRKGLWERTFITPRLMGKTLGLIGLGRIGKAIVPRAQGLGLKVLAYDPYPDMEFAATNQVGIVELDSILKTSDIISLHLPVSPDTENFINADRLQLMRPKSVLINTARGKLVDETALYNALKSGHLYAAGLDVFQEEPPQIDNPLLTLDNVLVCPHMGGLDEQSLVDMSNMAAQNIIDLHQGNWPDGKIVNDEIRDGWTW